MSKGKILVTGGIGYIGSHTITQLLNNNLDVISIDNLSNSCEDVNKQIEIITNKKFIFYNADLCNKELINNIFESNKDIKSIIHFAAYKSVEESVKQPLKYYNNNINSLINLLDLAYKFNVNSFVFSSSCTVYGQPDILPVTEKSPIKQPCSPYGNTKKICEEILKDFTLINSNFKVISLRYFNPIGAHPSGLIGELPLNVPNNLMPYITQTAFGIREKLKIYGGDYDTIDGTAIRDYIHIIDLADAHLKANNRILNNKMKSNFEVFNLGTGNGYSVLQVVNEFIKETGINIPYEIVERREGDIEKIWADSSLANKELNWKTKKTLADMVKDAWKWEKYYKKT